MRLNWTTRICGSRVELVPYRRWHVAKYHEWMKDPHVLEMTASEPLSLQEELDMQASWKNDPDKLTFIVYSCAGSSDSSVIDQQTVNTPPIDAADASDSKVVAQPNVIGSSNSSDELKNISADCSSQLKVTEKNREMDDLKRGVVMAGDTNLFFNDSDDRHCVEIEVMVAESGLRRGGLAFEALSLMIGYACKHLDVHKFIAKISEHNPPSLRLFEKLGFVCIAPSNCFEEITYELSLEKTAERLGELCERYTTEAKEEVDTVPLEERDEKEVEEQQGEEDHQQQEQQEK